MKMSKGAKGNKKEKNEKQVYEVKTLYEGQLYAISYV